eukprot:gene9340-9503_t
MRTALCYVLVALLLGTIGTQGRVLRGIPAPGSSRVAMKSTAAAGVVSGQPSKLASAEGQAPVTAVAEEPARAPEQPQATHAEEQLASNPPSTQLAAAPASAEEPKEPKATPAVDQPSSTPASAEPAATPETKDEPKATAATNQTAEAPVASEKPAPAPAAAQSVTTPAAVAPSRLAQPAGGVTAQDEQVVAVPKTAGSSRMRGSRQRYNPRMSSQSRTYYNRYSSTTTRAPLPAPTVTYGAPGTHAAVDPSKVEARPYNPRAAAQPGAIAVASRQASTSDDKPQVSKAVDKKAEEQDPEAKRKAALDRLLKPASDFMNMITEIQSRLPLPEKAAAAPKMQWGDWNGGDSVRVWREEIVGKKPRGPGGMAAAGPGWMNVGH